MAGIELLTLQFVDAPAADATVLLDLNDRSPLFITEDGWSAPPPQKQVSSFRSTARDGATVAQESYDDRELALKVGILAVSQDHAAENIQRIGRLLAGEQWLRYQPNTIAPVYFRCRPGEIEAIDELNGQESGLRILSLRIPAEYAAYGEAVTGTATIPNDPTAGTNPMSYVFPDVQGDVATPLALSLTNYDTGPNVARAIYSCFLGMSSGANVPLVPQIASSVTGPTATGWTVTNNYADSTAIGGTVTRFERSSSNATMRPVVTLPVLPTGDYRLFVRAKATTADVEMSAVPAQGVIPSDFSDVLGTDWRYFDVGVVRMPASAPFVEPPGLVSPTSLVGQVEMGFRRVGSASGALDISLDILLAVPVDLDGGVLSTMLLTGDTTSQSLGPLNVDGLSSVVWAGSASSFNSVPVAGGLPRAVPGTRNVLSLVRAGKARQDEKTDSSDLSWKYYPRYLYIRPATS